MTAVLSETTMSFFSEDTTNDVNVGVSNVLVDPSGSLGSDVIQCRVCRETLTTTQEYRNHLLNFHRDVLTEDELNGIVS